MAVNETIEVGRRETVVEATAEALIRYIAARGLRGGDRLPSERELVEMTGVSRLPLREALCMLKGLGIVEARHGKGVFVRDLDVAAVMGLLSPLLRTQTSLRPQEIVEARLHLEPVMAGLAARHRRPEHLATLASCLAGMSENLHDRDAFIRHDMAFHQEIAAATGNAIFRVIMAAITDLVRHVQFLFPDRADDRATSVRFHERLLAALRAGDATAAEEAMRAHLRDVEARI